MMRSILAGAAAGAAGSTALNAVTYLDMAVRGRPGSQTPEDTVKRVSDATHIPVPGEGEQRDNRISGLGPLLGLLTGVGVGAAYGAARGLGWRPGVPAGAAATCLAAMAGANLPMMAGGITDPRTWRPADWLSDLLPHLAYGSVTAAVQAATEERGGCGCRSWRRLCH